VATSQVQHPVPTPRPGRRARVHPPVRRSLLVVQGAVLVVLVLVTRPLWSPLLDDGPWTEVFSGYGSVETTDDGAVLSPMAPGSTDPADTHAALVVTEDSFGDLTVTAELRTQEQLRPGSPNPWEVGWLLWHETDPQHFYALALKPNGWELSKQVPGAPGGQQFLTSGTTPRFPVGEWHRITVTQHGAEITVSADGRPLTHHVDQDPYLAGAVGLYTEDAVVVFRDLVITTDGA
jgi:hypothetical protein